MGFRDLFVNKNKPPVTSPSCFEPSYAKMISAAMDKLGKPEFVHLDKAHKFNADNCATVQCLNTKLLQEKIANIAERSLDSFVKYRGVSRASTNGYIAELKREILKCDLLVFEKGSEIAESDAYFKTRFAFRKAYDVVNIMLSIGSRRNAGHHL